MKNKILQVRDTKLYLASLKVQLQEFSEVSAAYLFGSAAQDVSMVNDLDILVLLRKNANKHEAYINLTQKLSKALNISEHCIDLLFFDLGEIDPYILTRAVNKGILLKNDDPKHLGNAIDDVSRYFLENEAMMIRGKRLRQERMEAFSEIR